MSDPVIQGALLGAAIMNVLATCLYVSRKDYPWATFCFMMFLLALKGGRP